MFRKTIVNWLLVVAFSLYALTRRAEAAGTIGLPFREGEIWTVCRGYNVGNIAKRDIFHLDVPVLDLTIGSNSAGTNGCIGDANASTNEEVIAPGAGTITHISSVSEANDGVCLNLDSGGALKIFHLISTTRWPDGTTIQKGQVLGRLTEPNSYNGSYAHIHIQAQEGNCAGALVSFTEANGMRFEFMNGLPYDGSINQHSGTKFTNALSATWHPAGTLVRVIGDTKVFFLEKELFSGKMLKRHIANADVFNQSGFDWNAIVNVSAKELACYHEGFEISGPLLTQGWGIFPEGTLIRQTGTNPVSVISEGKPR